jgi:hypothetical protein
MTNHPSCAKYTAKSGQFINDTQQQLHDRKEEEEEEEKEEDNNTRRTNSEPS